MANAQPSQWKFDPIHSRLYFDISHIYATVIGQFDEFSGTIIIDPKTNMVTRCDMDVTVKSINTDNQQRDNDLRSKNFFDADKYPLMKFRSGEITRLQGNNFQISGSLTIKDVTKDVVVPCTFLGVRNNPMSPKHLVAGYNAKFTIDRLAYHVGTGQLYKMGVVGKDVGITVTFEVLKDK